MQMARAMNRIPQMALFIIIMKQTIHIRAMAPNTRTKHTLAIIQTIQMEQHTAMRLRMLMPLLMQIRHTTKIKQQAIIQLTEIKQIIPAIPNTQTLIIQIMQPIILALIILMVLIILALIILMVLTILAPTILTILMRLNIVT